MKIKPEIFREYDIRGTVGSEINDEFAYILGRAYAGLAKESNKNRIAVGHDCRLSSPSLASALCKGLSDEGVDALDIGMGPTPQLYFSIHARDLGGGIQVTGSHNPPEMNGFKICLGKNTLAGTEIQDLKQRAMSLSPSKGGSGTISKLDITEEYISHLVENSRPHMGKRKLKVVVDGGNGVGGLIGPKVLKRLGVEVIELFCDPDGRFPNHHPDPTVLENLTELVQTVKKEKADIGIGWDGDGDRIGVVDENGGIIFGDMLLLIYGRELLKTIPRATIIGDVKCSSLLFDDLRKRGANSIMWKTGHSLIKQKLRETGGELGGEMSGHIFFKHRYFGFDDAIYASCRILEVLSNTDMPTSRLLSDLPKTVSTPEIRVDCNEEIKFKIPDLMKKAFNNYEVDTIDGARIKFPTGWGLVRASNTQPVLVMRFEATSEQDLMKYRSLVTDKLEEIKNKLL